MLKNKTKKRTIIKPSLHTINENYVDDNDDVNIISRSDLKKNYDVKDILKKKKKRWFIFWKGGKTKKRKRKSV
jgi:hypothetical protein